MTKNIKFLLVILLFSALSSIARDSDDWKSDWALEDNFTLVIDSEGYNFPTSIAFVPQPGNGPKDALYFITELRGKVKVVTNDRTVHTFAEDFFKLTPAEELPASGGEVGLAGICLEPSNGYVFVTFAYHDSNNILRNNIVRFTTEPGTFSLKPSSMTDFSEIFSDEESSYSHQIGPCQVYDDLLYVSVGDAHFDKKSQSIDSVLGKVLRMTLDGKPSASNPFYADDNVKNARSYVWAYGLRNPFGLKIVDGRVFVAENGNNADRFMEVHEGRNYLWDGGDWSIGTNADVVFAPAVCPVQLDYYPESLNIFPEKFRGKFYLALGGNASESGPGARGDKSIVTLDYGFKENRMLSVPEHFLKYRGSGVQLVAGVAIGPDGLYFVPLFPDAGGRSAVFKILYDDSNAYPYKLRSETDIVALLETKACLGCHRMNGMGWGSVGPNLDRDPMVLRIEERLDSAEYIESVKKLDAMDTEPYAGFKDARKEVLEKEGMDKVRTWIKYHLLEPKFDNPSSQMPNVGLSEDEANAVTDFLLTGRQSADADVNYRAWRFLNHFIPELRYRYLAYSFLLGVVIAFLFVGAYGLYRKKR